MPLLSLITSLLKRPTRPLAHKLVLETCCSRRISSISTRPVTLAPSSIDVWSPEQFLSLALSPDCMPLLFISESAHAPTSEGPRSTSRGADLLRALRVGADRLVEVELGRYDDPAPGAFHRVPMRLGQYVDWLERNGGSGGRVDGQQVYLAQWRGADEVPEFRALVRPPSLLEPLLSDGRADLYQTSFFVGPTGAVTPLHHDPYMNLYHLHASSHPRTYAKHVTLLPPSAAGISRRADTLRNTSTTDLQLRPCSDHAAGGPEVRRNGVAFNVLGPEALDGIALSCVLREDETLFIPRGWWHRVENVALPGSDAPSASAGWTAGVGWWFLFRQT